MNIKRFTLPPISSETPLVKIVLPPRMEIIDPVEPRLTSIGDVEVVTVAVHDREVYLSARVMLERARKLGAPIDSREDMENILTRGLAVGCDYLVTGIKLHDLHGREDVLCLGRHDGRRRVRFRWVGTRFNGRHYQVLCYGEDK